MEDDTFDILTASLFLQLHYTSLLPAFDHDNMIAVSGLDLHIFRIVHSARLEVVRCLLECSIK